MGTHALGNTHEQITVRNFAGIEEVVVRTARITALIGPQASGKSVTAKLLYFFRGIWEVLFYPLEAESTEEDRKERLKSQFRKYFPPETWGKEVFSIQYEFGDHKVLLRRAPSRGRPSDGLILHLPGFVGDLFLKHDQYTQEIARNSRGSIVRSGQFDVWRKMEPELRDVLGRNFYVSQLFVPAGRAFFSNIERNVFSFIARSEKRLDPFLTEFGEYFSFVRSGGLRRHGAKFEYDTPLAEGLLGGALIYDKDKEFVKTRDGRNIPLGNLSSGQQEALPLLMMLENVESSSRIGRGTAESRHASYIEEPEAHLFPDFQKKITERIVEYAMAANGAQSVFITTHSPYVISTINVLMLAAKLGLKSSQAERKRVLEVVPQERWISTQDVSVFAFEGGRCESVIDYESGLVDATYLDQVSTQISQQFDSLLEIEFPGSEVTSR